MTDHNTINENITAEALIAKVRELAAARPDFIYEKDGDLGGCLYTHRDNTPGCIMGHAFAELGYPLDYDDDFNEGTGIGEFRFSGLMAQTDPEYPDHWEWTAASRWLEDVQASQDSGVPWGVAAEEADRHHPTV